MNSVAPKTLLLSIVELGGYPDFSAIYARAGFQTETVQGMRKAIRHLKSCQPAVIVAEFNFQSDFRDRTSSLESLMAVVQRLPDTKVVVFYEEEYRHQLQRLLDRFPVYATLAFPIDIHALEKTMLALAD